MLNQPKIYRFDTLESTNDYLEILAKNDIEHGCAVLANEQTQGKGTKGRDFFSPKGSGIYLSVLLKDVDTESLNFITPLAAVIVSEVIDEVCQVKSKIKWVNDIYIDSKKVCGILTKVSFLSQNQNYVIVGIGINLFKPKDDFPSDLLQTAGYVLDDIDEKIKDSIKEKIVSQIQFKLINQSLNLDKIQILKKYKNKSNLIKNQVSVDDGQNIYFATVLDIDDNCHLIVRDFDGNIHEISSGSVQVRLRGRK